MAWHTQRIHAKYCPDQAKGHFHDVPRLPRDMLVVTTGLNLDNAIRKKHAKTTCYSDALATENDDGGLQGTAACH